MYNAPTINGQKRTDYITLKQRKVINRARYERMTDMLVKGYTLAEIARDMQISHRAINTLKEKLDKRIKKIHNDNVDTLRDIKLRQYAWCQRELLEQWEASKKNSKGEAKRADVVFMDRILAIWEAERKMLGIDVVNKDDNPNSGPMFDWRSLTSLSVNINNNSPPKSIDNADNIVKKQVESALIRPISTQEIASDVEERIKELERRAALREEKQEIQRQLEENNGRSKRLVLKGRVIRTDIVPSSQEDSALASMLGAE